MSDISKLFRRLSWRLGLAKGKNAFLADCRGVIHVGANSGQERDLYRKHGLSVVWIEPIPSVYRKLVDNIRGYRDQIAIEALVTDRDGAPYEFKVASNAGASSSIFELGGHKDVWPDITYVERIAMTSQTLPTALTQAGVDIARYDTLVLDTQGSELMVLEGAAALLQGFRYIETEAADFEAYVGSTSASAIETFLASRGFDLIVRHENAKFRTQPDARKAAGGSYYKLLFKRRDG